MSNDISTPDGKHIVPGTHEDTEPNDEKVASGSNLNGSSYESQGTDVERALIFKQDLRIIPLCSVRVSSHIASSVNY
jgi:hypothetical protein